MATGDHSHCMRPVHQVKPYFGLGVNAAFEDVAALDRCLDDAPSMGAALAAFSRQRAPEARVLTQISRSFDRGGMLALFTFILPLILDGIFHGALPRLFAPNTLAMLQRPELTFSAIRRRKRTDRALQLALIGTAGVLATRLALTLVRAAANLLAAGGAADGRGPLDRRVALSRSSCARRRGGCPRGAEKRPSKPRAL